MTDLYIHIGTPRTGTTVLQKHLFPLIKNGIVFSKVAYKPSGNLINNSKTQISADPKEMQKYLEECKIKSDFVPEEFVRNMILSPVGGYAGESYKYKKYEPIMLEAINHLNEYVKERFPYVLISSERLCDTSASLACFSSHRYDIQFPVYPLAKLIQKSINKIPIILVCLRDPISYLTSKYFRTCNQRKQMGERVLTATEYIQKQVTLENRAPGTSSISHAIHSDFLKDLSKVGIVKAFGFKQLLTCSHLFQLLGIPEEANIAFSSFPRENKSSISDYTKSSCTKAIVESLKQIGLYKKLIDSKIYE